MDNLATALIHEMARRTATELTDRHYAILDFVDEYYQKNRVGPLYSNLKRHTGATKDEINELFPHGINSVYTWVGIPIHTPNSGCKPLVKVDVENYREVYLDHNGTTYVRDEIRDLLSDQFAKPSAFGNPSSSTNLGRDAHSCVKNARAMVADCLDVSPEEIYFTGGGSEANNLAIKGVAFQHLGKGAHIVTTSIEHGSVLETVKFLETLGFDATYVDCGRDGRISPESIERAITDKTVLVSVMAVNNEIGTINPIADIGDVCCRAKVPFMVDAIQAFGKVPIVPKRDGISMLSLSGHKIYAPKGIAALYVDRNVNLVPLVHGGGQESGVRSGTEAVESITALGHAAHLIHQEREREMARLTELREYFLSGLKEIQPGYIVNGSLEHRTPNNLNIGFPDIDSGSLLLSLNQIGVYISSGSACHAGSVESSHVLKSLGVDTDKYGSVRFSFGLRTSREEIDYLFTYLGEILDGLKENEAA